LIFHSNQNQQYVWDTPEATTLRLSVMDQNKQVQTSLFQLQQVDQLSELVLRPSNASEPGLAIRPLPRRDRHQNNLKHQLQLEDMEKEKNDKYLLSVASSMESKGSMFIQDKSEVHIDPRPDWYLVYLDCFDVDANGWTFKARQRCGSSADHFLGGPCQFGNLNVSKEFDNLPPHTLLRITARFHFLITGMVNTPM